MALGISQNTSRLTRRALTGVVALTALGLSACYPELYSKEDPYLAEIKASQVGLDHGADHGEEEQEKKAHGEEHGEAH